MGNSNNNAKVKTNVQTRPANNKPATLGSVNGYNQRPAPTAPVKNNYPESSAYPWYPPNAQYPGYPSNPAYAGYPPNPQYPGYPPNPAYPGYPSNPAYPDYPPKPAYPPNKPVLSSEDYLKREFYSQEPNNIPSVAQPTPNTFVYGENFNNANQAAYPQQQNDQHSPNGHHHRHHHHNHGHHHHHHHHHHPSTLPPDNSNEHLPTANVTTIPKNDSPIVNKDTTSPRSTLNTTPIVAPKPEIFPPVEQKKPSVTAPTNDLPPQPENDSGDASILVINHVVKSTNNTLSHTYGNTLSIARKLASKQSSTTTGKWYEHGYDKKVKTITSGVV